MSSAGGESASARSADTTWLLGATKPASSPPAEEPSVAAKKTPFAERGAVEALDRIAYLFPIETTEHRKKLTLPSDALFSPGSDSLEAAAPVRLDSLAGALKEQGPHTIRVLAYTDSLGKVEENRAVSDRRANTLRNYFVARGVDPERIVAEGKGATRFVASNGTPEGRAANRRIEIWIE